MRTAWSTSPSPTERQWTSRPSAVSFSREPHPYATISKPMRSWTGHQREASLTTLCGLCVSGSMRMHAGIVGLHRQLVAEDAHGRDGRAARGDDSGSATVSFPVGADILSAERSRSPRKSMRPSFFCLPSKPRCRIDWALACAAIQCRNHGVLGPLKGSQAISKVSVALWRPPPWRLVAPWQWRHQTPINPKPPEKIGLSAIKSEKTDFAQYGSELRLRLRLPLECSKMARAAVLMSSRMLSRQCWLRPTDVGQLRQAASQHPSSSS